MKSGSVENSVRGISLLYNSLDFKKSPESFLVWQENEGVTIWLPGPKEEEQEFIYIKEHNEQSLILIYHYKNLMSTQDFGYELIK